MGRHYAEEIGLRDPQIVNYVAHLLAEFCDAEELFGIRNAEGRPLTDVGDMLVESNPVLDLRLLSIGERQVRKHIGDYTLSLPACSQRIDHFRLRRNRLKNPWTGSKAGKGEQLHRFQV